MESDDWFERTWEYREEIIYRNLFGSPEESGIYVLKPIAFERRFSVESLDPRWLHHGVILFPPNNIRNSWMYVSSGLSNAWEDSVPNPAGVSGIGCEFIMETPSRYLWMIGQIHEIIAFQLLISCGRFPRAELVKEYHRIPLRESIEPGGNSNLTSIMVCPVESPLDEQQLESGTFRFMRLIGITESEAAYARKEGPETLISMLKEAGIYPLTDPSRESVA